jgi:hypothetical protein
LDESGASVTRASLRPSDVAAVALGVGVATLGAHSPSFTLNNLVGGLGTAGPVWGPPRGFGGDDQRCGAGGTAALLAHCGA